MSPAITRKGFLRGAASGAMGAAAAGAAVAASARAAETLDASFTSPYAPHPVIRHPSSWFTYSGLMPGVAMPYQVAVCNRQLAPLRDVDGGPDLSTVPDDATMLMLCLYDPVPREAVTAPDISQAVPINGTTMHFSDLGGGEINYYGFRQFLGWHILISGDTLYSIETRVYVGPNASSEWTQVQPIVDSVHASG
jgi:hypothetical protein